LERHGIITGLSARSKSGKSVPAGTGKLIGRRFQVIVFQGQCVFAVDIPINFCSDLVTLCFLVIPLKCPGTITKLGLEEIGQFA
jgi:hypothetical protein